MDRENMLVSITKAEDVYRSGNEPGAWFRLATVAVETLVETFSTLESINVSTSSMNLREY